MAANYFLQFEGPEVEGEADQDGYEKHIEILSFNWGVSQSGGFSYAGGGTAASANLQDLSLSFRQCSASPKLMQHCASGRHFEKAFLRCLRATGDEGGQAKYLEIELEDVVISSYQTGGSGDDMPIESMSLNFAKIREEFFTLDQAGTATSAGEGIWDQRKKVTTK